MPRVALSPQLKFGPLILLVEARTAFESSELKMRAGLIRNTETTPVYVHTGVTGPSMYRAIYT